MDMINIYENGGFSPDWLERDEEQFAPITQRKDLSVLLEELEEIKTNIEKVQIKQWYLAKLIIYHNAGFTKT